MEIRHLTFDFRGEKLEECLEDNGFEDAINGDNGKLDMQKLLVHTSFSNLRSLFLAPKSQRNASKMYRSCAHLF
jgi:hypothetical protein